VSEPPVTEERAAVDIARLEALRQLIGDDEFRRLADKFLGDLARRVDAMGRLSAAGDVAALGREAHTLRGTAGSYGLETVATLAERLEAACATAEPERVAGGLRALTAGMTASMARLSTEFGLDK